MATTYKWDVNQIEVATSASGFSQVITRAMWQCVATSDSGATKSQIGVIDFNVANLNTATFIPYSSMTATDIVNLITATVHYDVIQQGLAYPDFTVVDFTGNASADPNASTGTTSTNTSTNVGG